MRVGRTNLLIFINLSCIHRWIWWRTPCGQRLPREWNNFKLQRFLSCSHISCSNLRVVDRFNNMLVSGYITAGGLSTWAYLCLDRNNTLRLFLLGIYFLLLHEGRSDESIKSFFTEVHELYVKNLLNPFYKYDSPIVSSAFDTHVKALGRRYLL